MNERERERDSLSKDLIRDLLPLGQLIVYLSNCSIY